MPRKTAERKSWKAVQSKRQIRKRTRFALIVLAAILAILLLSQAVKFTQMLFSPMIQSSKVLRTTFWNGDFNLNIIILAKGISLLTFSPQDQKLTLIDAPNNLYLEAAHGFGKWQISSIYDLGESQNVGGGKLLKDSLENLFGLPIDGFLQLSGQYSQKKPDMIVSEIRKDPFSIISILPYLKTDLTPFELIRLKMGLSGVRFDKIKYINLESTDSLQGEKLADGTFVYNIDTVRLDAMLSGLKDAALQSENKTIAIFNSTNHPGLAQKAARLITNIGGNVIITQNGQNKLKSSLVAGEKSKTLERIKQIFEAGDIIDHSNEIVSSRAEINLFLGEDFFEQL